MCAIPLGPRFSTSPIWRNLPGYSILSATLGCSGMYRPQCLSATRWPTPSERKLWITGGGKFGPHVDPVLVPFIQEIMYSGFSEDLARRQLCEGAMRKLKEGGPNEQQRMADEALSASGARESARAGRYHTVKIVWGPTMRCLDFEAQSVLMGPLHFAAIDMGGAIKLNQRMQMALGPESSAERNQCATKHLALRAEWDGVNRSARVPSRNRAAPPPRMS